MPISRSREWWLNTALFLLATAIILWLLSSVAGPLLFAWLMAYLLAPLVGWLHRHGVSRSLATPLVFLFGLIIAVLCLVLLLPPLFAQTVHAVQALPDIVLHLKEQWAPWVKANLGIDIGGNMQHWSTWLHAQIAGVGLEKLKPWANWSLSAIGSLLGSLLGLFKLILVPLFAFYLLHDWEKIGELIKQRLPHASRALILRLGNEIDTMISTFLRGQFSICLILAACYSLGLYLLGIPFALVIGLAAGLLGFIPYVGPVGGFCTAGLASLWHFGWDIHLLGVALVFVAAHLLESFYLTPKVLGDKLGLHPLVILLALTIAADRFGFAGLLMAVPVTAAATVLLREIDRRYRENLRTDTP